MEKIEKKNRDVIEKVYDDEWKEIFIMQKYIYIYIFILNICICIKFENFNFFFLGEGKNFFSHIYIHRIRARTVPKFALFSFSGILFQFQNKKNE